MAVEIEINKILNDFGMNGITAAKAMNIKEQTFRNKKSGIPGHSFNQKNLEDLKHYVIKHADKLKKK